MTKAEKWSKRYPSGTPMEYTVPFDCKNRIRSVVVLGSAWEGLAGMAVTVYAAPVTETVLTRLLFIREVEAP